MQKRVVSGKNGAKTLKGFENFIFTTKYDTPLNAQIYADAIKAIVEQINLMREELDKLDSRLEMIELSSDDLAEQRFEREYRKQNEVLSSDKLVRIE